MGFEIGPQAQLGYAWEKRLSVTGDTTHHNMHLGLGLAFRKDYLEFGGTVQALINSTEAIGGGLFGGIGGRYGGLRLGGGLMRFMKNADTGEKSSLGVYLQATLHLGIPYNIGRHKTILQPYLGATIFLRKRMGYAITAGIRFFFSGTKTKPALTKRVQSKNEKQHVLQGKTNLKKTPKKPNQG